MAVPSPHKRCDAGSNPAAPTITKACPKCKTTKLITEYTRHTGRPTGAHSWCRQCMRTANNARYKANPAFRERIRRNANRRASATQEWLLEYLLAHPCIDCGDTDIRTLDFDHRNPKEKHLSICVMLKKSLALDAIKDEVRKCDVRCASCHRKRTCDARNDWRSRAQAARTSSSMVRATAS